MKYTTLGKTGIEVSRICVGCMSYGKASEDFHQWTLGPEDTQAMVKHAIDLGVNFFDTANVYSFGTSEEYLGRAFKNIGIPRDKGEGGQDYTIWEQGAREYWAEL